jgi:curli biogenesis system outer membrane secretion channel CsgG
VITGRILQYEWVRNSRPNLPLVVGFPETSAHVSADLRIVDARDNGDLFSTNLRGVGRKGRGVRMFPISGDDRTSYLNEVEKNKVWDDAMGQVVHGLLREMSENFKWFSG